MKTGFVFQELELKLTADAVLCEVKKKQTDVRRMQDVLRSLEKLRRLRKEAASKKGDSCYCLQPSTLILPTIITVNFGPNLLFFSLNEPVS